MQFLLYNMLGSFVAIIESELNDVLIDVEIVSSAIVEFSGT